MQAFLSRIVLLILAVVLIFVGLVVLPLPIPFGAAMILTGLTILIASNDTAAGWIRKWREQNPRMNQRILALESRLPDKLGKILRRTTP